MSLFVGFVLEVGLNCEVNACEMEREVLIDMQSQTIFAEAIHTLKLYFIIIVECWYFKSCSVIQNVHAYLLILAVSIPHIACHSCFSTSLFVYVGACICVLINCLL